MKKKDEATGFAKFLAGVKRLVTTKKAPVPPTPAEREAAYWRTRFPNAHVQNPDAKAELERRAEINARGAELRAENAALLDELMSGRRRWVPFRPGWLRREGPRSRWTEFDAGEVRRWARGGR